MQRPLLLAALVGIISVVTLSSPATAEVLWVEAPSMYARSKQNIRVNALDRTKPGLPASRELLTYRSLPEYVRSVQEGAMAIKTDVLMKIEGRVSFDPAAKVEVIEIKSIKFIGIVPRSHYGKVIEDLDKVLTESLQEKAEPADDRSKKTEPPNALPGRSRPNLPGE